MSHATRPAFTLVELIVVVAVIGILAGLLLPVLNMVRSSAKNVACQASLRQLGMANVAYMVDHRGIICPHSMNASETSGDWLYRLGDYLEDAKGERGGSDRGFKVAQYKSILRGCPVWPEVERPAGEVDWATAAQRLTTGYAWAAWMNDTTDFTKRRFLTYEYAVGAGHMPFIRAASVNAHASRPLVGDFYHHHIFTWLQDQYVGMSFRHKGMSNVAWLDGHVAAASKDQLFGAMDGGEAP